MSHENFYMLSAHAIKLLVDLGYQYNGGNNGDLAMPWSWMKKRHWKSKSTLYAARKELINRGWIVNTRQGGKHCASLYAITWLPIDDCGGKMDSGWKKSTIPLNLWRQNKNATPNADHTSTASVPFNEPRVEI